MDNMSTSTLEQEDQIMNNVPRLVKRNRRVDCAMLGGKKTKEGEVVNLFSDADLYHHLLRELIEKKTAVTTDSAEVGWQWLQLRDPSSRRKLILGPPRGGRGAR